ncbi:MAG: deoxyguanosinetriphosphate triphosphohydrolase [Kineosporiaceae bacterium]
MTYSDGDRARWVPEPPKDPGRGEFARDRARVLHSSALRRLAAKTQVVGPGSDDFTRTRLTHSLEVAQIGRELGAALGCDPDVVDTACLSHDLGHPPFGHNGETALDDLAADIGGFEGNAQTLRVLTRLEPKIVDPRTGRGVGVNLTRASLDAVAKYPWRRGQGPPHTSPAKYGVYADDAEVFAWLRHDPDAAGARRCLEAQVMDVADDIAYSVHDVEDAVVAGSVDLGWLDSPEVRGRVAGRARSWYDAGITDADVEATVLRLSTLPTWVAGFDGSLRALAALKNHTSQLIGRFTRATQVAMRDRYGPGPLARYRADLVVPEATRAEIVVLKAVAAEFVMSAAARRPEYERQREVLVDLVGLLTKHAPEGLDPMFADLWAHAPDDGARLRVVVDQVASLTDASAVLRRARLLTA